MLSARWGSRQDLSPNMLRFSSASHQQRLHALACADRLQFRVVRQLVLQAKSTALQSMTLELFDTTPVVCLELRSLQFAWRVS